MCDIWRIRQVREVTPGDLRRHLESIRTLGVRWVVFSGGEPLMHSDLATLARMFHDEGIRVTLLTAGLTIKQHAALIAENFDEVIVSLDGPPTVHDRIRAVPRAFDRLNSGVHALRLYRASLPIRGRSTVQRANFRFLREIVSTARNIGLVSISFLAADVTSTAFNRPEGWTHEQKRGVALEAREIDELEREIAALIREYSDDIASGFISENPEKLNRIVQHFRAEAGETPPVAPPCNAPWVSAVIEADGSVRPCFFHRSFGNIHDKPLAEIVNGKEGIAFREQLDIRNDPTCRNCVCSLYLPEEKSNLERSASPEAVLEQALPK